MKDLTAGSIRKHVLAMAGAYLANMLTGTLFSLANIYWVGKLGATEQAAVTLAAIPIMLVLTLLPVVSVGTAILTAHAVGAKDQARANRIFNEALGASWLVTTLIGLIAWSNRESFGTLLTSDSGAADSIARYYSWFIPSVVIQVPMLVMAAAFGAIGNIRIATAAQSGTVLLNAALAPVLMFGWAGFPALGIEGTGLASFLACGVTLAGLLLYSCRPGSYLRLRPAIWFARPTQLWGAIRIGLPTGLESGVVAGYMMVIALLMRPFGSDELAGFGIGQRILQASLLPLMALSSATSIVAAQNHGAGSSDRVRETLRTSMGFGLIAAPLLFVLLESVPQWICGLFSTDRAVIEAGSLFLRIDAFSLVPAAIAYSIFAVLSGMGNTRASLYCSGIYAALVVVPAWALSKLPGFRPEWLWKVMVAATVLQAVVAGYFLRRQFSRARGGHDGLPAAEMEAA